MRTRRAAPAVRRSGVGRRSTAVRRSTAAWRCAASRRVARVLVAALVLLSAGCIDFLAPKGQAGNTPTRLDVVLHLARNPTLSCPGCITSEYTRIPTPAVTGPDTTVAWLEGTLDPGTDLSGETRTVLDGAPRVLGVSVAPADTTALGRRHYASRWTLPGDSVGPVVLEAPRVAALSPPDPVVHWSVPWSQSADTVRLAPGQDLPLVLTVRPDTASRPAPNFENWQVEVSGTRGFRIGADGPPPDTLVIPARFLPPSPDSTLVARMSIVEGITPAPGQNYQIVFALSVALAWIIVETPK